MLVIYKCETPYGVYSGEWVNQHNTNHTPAQTIHAIETIAMI